PWESRLAAERLEQFSGSPTRLQTLAIGAASVGRGNRAWCGRGRHAVAADGAESVGGQGVEGFRDPRLAGEPAAGTAAAAGGPRVFPATSSAPISVGRLPRRRKRSDADSEVMATATRISTRSLPVMRQETPPSPIARSAQAIGSAINRWR